MDTMRLAAAERAEFADFLDTLTVEQWDAPSLCAGWRVRDVVAHAVSFDELDGRGVVGRVLKSRFSPSRVNELGVEAYRDHTPDELVAVLRAHLEPSGVNAAFGGLAALTDTVVHQQDIRRPLGIARQVPAERLAPALRAALVEPTIGGLWRARGLRLVATDLDWSAGFGSEVRGPGEALLMTVAGRRGVTGELDGPGASRLADRILG